jgi:hypothetical protein
MLQCSLRSFKSSLRSVGGTEDEVTGIHRLLESIAPAGCEVLAARARRDPLARVLPFAYYCIGHSFPQVKGFERVPEHPHPSAPRAGYRRV